MHMETDSEYSESEEEFLEDTNDIEQDEIEIYGEEDEIYDTIVETVDVNKDLDYYETFETEDFSWNAECIKLFLNLYRERIHLFRDPKVKKKLIWKQIQDIFRNLGYSIGLLALAGKFRNLKHMFNKINARISENANYPNKWPYYEAMAEILDENVQIDESSSSIFVSEKFDEPRINLFNWTDDKIMLLLTSYKDRKLEFAKFPKKSKPLWKEIKAIFWSRGIKCTVEQLHKKYRLLRGTFRKIQEKLKRRGQTESNWQYFNVFKEITDVPQEIIDKRIRSKKEPKDKSFWTGDMIKLLIRLYNSKKHKFQNPLITKSTLWNQIKDHFNINGYDVTSEMIYNKFKDLKNTYQKIIRRHPETDKIFTRWPYYNLMKDVLENKDTISFDEEVVDEEDFGEEYDEKEYAEDSKHNAPGCYHWPIKAVEILLTSYKERIVQFADKYLMKKILWKEIKEILAKNGYDIEQTIIEKKFRTLKHRYLRICNLKQRKTCKWIFFQLMTSIVNPDGTLKLNDHQMEFDDLSKTPDDEPFIWTSGKINLLLHNYYERRDSFLNPKINNRSLWQEIVEDFMSKGYNVNEDIVSEKMRHLRNNFLRSGHRSTKWEHYDVMAKIYEKNNNIDKNDTTLTLRTEGENMVSENCDFTWTFEVTKLLIDCYIERKNDFNDPSVRNTALWNEIAKICLDRNYKVTGTMLSKKFKTLKRTYMRNKQKLSKNEIPSSKWLFFNSMDKIFGGDQTTLLKDDIDSREDHYDAHKDKDEDDDYSDVQFIYFESSTDNSEVLLPNKEPATKLSITPIHNFPSNESDDMMNNILKLSQSSNERLNSLENKLIKMQELLIKNNELQITNNNMLKKYLTALHDRL